ncbi:unnamed protein product [Lymnaea stagnalis]|uniref:Acyl-coenzyme A oxidase n=1 Tax=Lymnaea stagnalis TaxID=6523 RepID=A0AAV2HE51_LYMST
MAAVFEVDASSMPVNEDLAKERATASFNVTELTHILDGGPEKTRRRKELEHLVLTDPVFKNQDVLYMNKSEAYDHAVHKSVRLIQLRKKYLWSDEEAELVAQKINASEEAFTLHRDMFMPALERLCTDEQKAKWLPLAINHHIIGTYAQTELGHGTNLMKLETTATFDANNEEFVLNTPRISSMKWWPGALGKSSTHAIVLAQLTIGTRHYGLQAFIVPLRSLEDHTPLPGVHVGDIGPKLTLSHVDNGFLILKNVRIPRENMLMRNAIVTRDGKFIALKGDKSNYSTMMYVRVMITRWAFGILSRAIVTGVRYSAVRRQSSLKLSGDELQILDYQAQQYKIFPAVAAMYSIFFTSQRMTKAYNDSLPELLNGNNALLAEFHSQSSAMKALCGEISAEHVEIMRRALGGHGFMKLSGLTDLHHASLVLITIEGENTVLYQQTARYILKQLAAAVSGEHVRGTSAYLGQSFDDIRQIESEADCRDLDLLLNLYKKMAQRIVSQTGQHLQADLEAGLPKDEAWNKNMVSLVRAAKVSGKHAITSFSNVEALRNLKGTASPELVTVLSKLCCLFSLYVIETNSGHFLETEAISSVQLEIIRRAEMQLLQEIRPEAVALVDAVDVPDECLKSALGCYDGNVYERMYAAALNEPMNKSEVHPSYYKYIRGLLRGTVSKL